MNKPTPPIVRALRKYLLLLILFLAIHHEIEPQRRSRYGHEIYLPSPSQRVNCYYDDYYYDVCPWSASERYIGTTRPPKEDRYPDLGSIAQACIIDTQEQSVQTVRTRV
jgi:hypothetical protein